MTDSAYINPSERDPSCNCGTKKRGYHHPNCSIYWIPDYKEIKQSHAVVDSIAAEAIDILRQTKPAYFHLDDWRRAKALIQRFDNLNNQNKEQ